DGPRLVRTQLINHVHAALVVFRLALALHVTGLDFSQLAVFLESDRHLVGNFLFLFVEVVPEAGVQRSRHHQQHQDLQLRRSPWTGFDRRCGRGAAAPLALLLRDSQQIDSDHRSSKLLRAKPTATASWPAFWSINSAPMPSAGGEILWNGFR